MCQSLNVIHVEGYIVDAENVVSWFVLYETVAVLMRVVQDDMVDGYGAGLRYTMGIPFRIDFAINDGFDKTRSYWVYISIGQAF